jgi:hypothetical protein
MKVMVLVKATANSEAGKMPSHELLEAMGKYNEELVKAGIMQAGDGLHPSAKGKRIRIAGKQRTVIDGPFAETKELVAGYWIWNVRSMDEAERELRPVFEAEDFGPELAAELRAQEDRLREELERQQKKG